MKELQSIRRAVDNGVYTPEQGKDEATKVQQEIVVLEIERSEIKIEQYNSEIVLEFTTRFLGNIALLWEKLDLSKKQALLQKIFLGNIIVTSDKKIRTPNLSPSFQLITALKAEKVENVTPSYVGLNELLQSAVDWIVDLQRLFEPEPMVSPQYV